MNLDNETLYRIRSESICKPGNISFFESEITFCVDSEFFKAGIKTEKE